jgi:hypothetical protein
MVTPAADLFARTLAVSKFERNWLDLPTELTMTDAEHIGLDVLKDMFDDDEPRLGRRESLWPKRSTIARLVEAGYVEKCRKPGFSHDSVFYRPTPAGLAALDEERIRRAGAVPAGPLQPSSLRKTLT